MPIWLSTHLAAGSMESCTQAALLYGIRYGISAPDSSAIPEKWWRIADQSRNIEQSRSLLTVEIAPLQIDSSSS